MRLSSILLFAVALVMGLGAAFLAVNWLEQQRGILRPVATGPDTKMRKVVVASQPLRFGTEITPVNLKEIEWPVGAVPAGEQLNELQQANRERKPSTECNGRYNCD